MFCVPVHFVTIMCVGGEAFMDDRSMEGEIQMAKPTLDSARRSLVARERPRGWGRPHQRKNGRGERGTAPLDKELKELL